MLSMYHCVACLINKGSWRRRFGICYLDEFLNCDLNGALNVPPNDGIGWIASAMELRIAPTLPVSQGRIPEWLCKRDCRQHNQTM